MERFLRTEHLIGTDNLEKLNRSFGVIIGLGAVGGYALEVAARSGLGRLRLVDFDTVEISNINRQILALESTLGQNKTDLARNRVLDINPACKVDVHDLFANYDTMDEILSDEPGFVIDAIDSISPKLALLETCWKRNIPVFSSMGAALRTNPVMVRTGDLMDTSNCALARQMRKGLRRRDVGRGIQCVYSLETPREILDKQVYYVNPDTGRKDERLRHNILGSLPGITGIFGMTLGTLAVESLIPEAFSRDN